MADILRFRRVTGELDEFPAITVDVDLPAGDLLTARTISIEDGTPGGRALRQHRVAATGERRHDGYARLDNEILTGRRLHNVAAWGRYPRELAQLYGDESISADPYTLFEPYQGEPLRDVGAYLSDGFDSFVTGLLTGLCWLAGAGIAHRALSPDTVWWDTSGHVQITDFSRSAPFGTARTPLTGASEWIARESRPDTCYGAVGSADDVWAAAKLMYFVRSNGEVLDDPGKLAEIGLSQMFNDLLRHVFNPPEMRPTARDLAIHGLRRPDLVPSIEDQSKPLENGRRKFLDARRTWHRGAAEEPPEFWDDVSAWRRSLWETGGPEGGGR